MYVFVESRYKTTDGCQVLIPRELPLSNWARDLTFRLSSWKALYTLTWYRDPDNFVIVREDGLR